MGDTVGPGTDPVLQPFVLCSGASCIELSHPAVFNSPVWHVSEPRKWTLPPSQPCSPPLPRHARLDCRRKFFHHLQTATEHS